MPHGDSVNAFARSTSTSTPNRAQERAPVPTAGWTSGSSSRSLPAVRVPNRREARAVSPHTTGAAASLWMTQTLASRLRNRNG